MRDRLSRLLAWLKLCGAVAGLEFSGLAVCHPPGASLPAEARRLSSECRHRSAAMPPDIRWQQRFANFCQALDQLETFFLPPPTQRARAPGLDQDL